MTKEEIRNFIKSIRREMEPSQVNGLSNKIRGRLFKLEDISAYNDFFVYNSFINEVNTQKIIKKLLEMNKNVYLPKLLDGEMYMIKIDENSSYRVNTLGAEEPVGDIVELQNFVTITPCVAVDRKLNRIGFGGGYYDKFFAKHNCLKIALCYQFQVVDNVPSDEFDVPVDIIITEREVIR